VVIVRKRGGNSVPAVFHSESQASAFIRARIAKGTVVQADEAGSWDNLHERFEVKRINHQEAYSLDGACTNWAEEYFSRLRRAEVGIHHHIAGAYLLRYAQESSWREDNRRVSNGDQVSRVAALALKRAKSVDFTGDWQRHTGPQKPGLISSVFERSGKNMKINQSHAIGNLGECKHHNHFVRREDGARPPGRAGPL
jgi:hypothetical protein